MVTWSTSSYSIRVRTVMRPMAPAPPRTIICIKLAPCRLRHGDITHNSITHESATINNPCRNGCLTDDCNSRRQNACMEFMECILQAIQDGINLFASDNQWRLDTNNSRVIQSTRYENTTFEKT